ncbi:MAG TPA: hypothetical protein VJ925_00920 [Longimicrobiales bacterium]|nr:hypothetical protein [Longimicrobiales bacterium]
MINRSAGAVRVEILDAAVVPVYRAMTPAQRVEAGLSATDMIRDRLYATIRGTHPDWTDEAVAQAVSERMLGARV